MKVVQASCRVTITTPAKLNLFLEILGKRSDGYHEIETLMVAVDRYDTLTVEEGPDGRVTLASRWIEPRDAVPAGRESLPAPADNLAVKAVELVRRRYGLAAGARLRLAKRIPAAGGMGGASSDAAAALVAVNRLWQLRLSRDDLASLAAELGSDVPFFLYGGAVIGRGRGERIEPLANLAMLHAVVVRPNTGLATADVYRQCEVPKNPCRVEQLVAGLTTGQTQEIQQGMMNRLEAAAERLSPLVTRLREAFASSGCFAWQLTGSGSCYFGLCHSARHARHVAARLRACNLGYVFVVRSIADGYCE